MDHEPEIHARLTPAMRLLVERMAQAPYPPMHTLTAAEAKAAYAASIGVLDVPRPELPRVQDLRIPARDGAQLPARLVAPSHAAGLPVLLYLHGGGFTIGSVESHDTVCRVLARQSGAAVLSLDYRLAPEHRFPPPCTTPGTRCTGWRARARPRSGWMARASPLAAIRPVAHWRRSAPSMRATRA